MRPILMVLISAACAFAQGMGGIPGQKFPQYQPSYEDVKSALGLSDEQLAELKKMQQDKMTATQSFYSKMGDRQKELNGLLESNPADPTKIGQLMLELQQLRKQPPPSAGDSHEKAVSILNAEQKHKLLKIEEAQKLRAAVDQAMQLALINPPPAPANAGKPLAPRVGAPAKQ